MKSFSVIIIVMLTVMAVSASSSEADVRSLFDGLVAKYNRSYDGYEEYVMRFNYFKGYLAEKARLEEANPNFQMAFNQFFDRSYSEVYNGETVLQPITYESRRRPRNSQADGSFADAPFDMGTHFSPDTSDLPDSFSWRDEGKMSPVRNQGSCGSCWAHAGGAVAESTYYINTGLRFDVSPQWGVDCSGTGCGGNVLQGLLSGAVYLDSRLPTYSQYPYTGSVGVCQNDFEGKIRVDSFGYLDSALTNHDSTEIMAALYRYGPLTAGICASTAVQGYSSGVITNSVSNCEQSITNCPSEGHAVVITGWGTTNNNIPYWEVRNSWGSSWGDEGYFKLERDDGRGSGACAIQTWIVIGIADEENEEDTPEGGEDWEESAQTGDASGEATGWDMTEVSERIAALGETGATFMNLFSGWFAQNVELTYIGLGTMFGLWFFYFIIYRPCRYRKKKRAKAAQLAAQDMPGAFPMQPMGHRPVLPQGGPRGLAPAMQPPPMQPMHHQPAPQQRRQSRSMQPAMHPSQQHHRSGSGRMPPPVMPPAGGYMAQLY